MGKHNETDFEKLIHGSEKVSWKVEDLVPEEGFKIEFDHIFLPESLTKNDELSFLNESELLDLNHIRGASYFNLFAFVEEYITSLNVTTAYSHVYSNNDELRALLRFAEEEVKHQILFERYLSYFNDQFKVKCNFLTGADQVAGVILSNSKSAVYLLTLHLELVTQDHYTSYIKEESQVNEHFKLILQKHWQEESQHAKIDFLVLKEEASSYREEDIEQIFNEYYEILASFKEIMKSQVSMDLDSLKKCTNRSWSLEEETQFKEVVLRSYVHNFINLGFNNDLFRSKIKLLFGEKYIRNLDKFNKKINN